jgi:hypothetical protein
MRTALKILAVLIIGVALGLGATWFTALRGGMSGGLSDGPWRTSLYAGSSQGGPYVRANVAAHGLLALNRSETIYYTATRDSAGRALDGGCAYRLEGRDPPTRWWSVTAYGPDDFLIPGVGDRYSVSKTSIVRAEDGGWTAEVSTAAAGVNAIPVKPGPFSLTLRLYNPDPSIAARPAAARLPTIIREWCT